ncbi:hypothetical protein CEUSTIGMA_g3706.t1 [Chlamydomonas eustigma]|uniref:Uncharacterized protein n=1 Tax=Chlamydomonas eustigma TaxID=1157962 RepID=A0A250X049_9CHLO|nr:hypothetical protein CEUSTIGMA_g3706.t1 [Chlamydomonas eustigma]|eukprot:GAX76262.1 hypothetical protein CEUSTIGMA_g3706.t1 [Chlamydomonas eustigma]
MMHNRVFLLLNPVLAFLWSAQISAQFPPPTLINYSSCNSSGITVVSATASGYCNNCTTAAASGGYNSTTANACRQCTVNSDADGSSYACLGCLNYGTLMGLPDDWVEACLGCVPRSPSKESACINFCMNKDSVSSGAEVLACANCVASASVGNVAGCLSCMGNSSNVITGQPRNTCFDCVAKGNDGTGCSTCATLSNTSSAQQGTCFNCLTPEPLDNVKCFVSDSSPSSSSLPSPVITPLPPSPKPPLPSPAMPSPPSVTLSSVTVGNVQSRTNSGQSGGDIPSPSRDSSASTTTVITVAVVVSTVCAAAVVAGAVYFVRARQQRSKDAAEETDKTGSSEEAQLPVMREGLPMASCSSIGSLPRPEWSEEDLQAQMQARREQLDHAMTARQKGDCRAAIWHYEKTLDISRAIQEYSPDMYAYGQIAEWHILSHHKALKRPCCALTKQLLPVTICSYTSLGKSQKASEYYDLYVAAVDERSSRPMGGVVGVVAVYVE